MECIDQLKIYKRQKPQEISLWKLLNHHFVDFEESYDELFQHQSRFYRQIIPQVVCKYPESGDLNQSNTSS